MVRSFQAKCDRQKAGGEIDDSTGDEEWRHTPRAFLMQRDGGFRYPLDPADAGSDQDTRSGLLVIAFRVPAGVIECLACRAHCKHDEFIDLALLFRLHPLV